MFMDFKEFEDKVKIALEEFYGNDYIVYCNEVKKNNGLILHGISVLPKEKDKKNTISPTIYLEDMYERYHGKLSFGNIIQMIINIYDTYKISSEVNMDFFLKYDLVKNRIVYKIINFEKNEQLLKEIPYIPFLDMAIVFQYHMENENFGRGTILIHDSHIKKWGITKLELYEDAKRNTPKILPGIIRNMEELVIQMMRSNLDEEEYNIGDLGTQIFEDASSHSSDDYMYVLSNREGQNGASCILYPGILKEFAQSLNSNLFILPSSVHEVILVKESICDDWEELQNMVQEVNQKELAMEDILSDQVYYYSSQTDRIIKCSKESMSTIKLQNVNNVCCMRT